MSQQHDMALAEQTAKVTSFQLEMDALKQVCMASSLT